MKNILCTEFNKLKNRYLYLSLMLGIGLAIIHSIIVLLPTINFILTDGYPENVYNHIIGFDNSFARIVYYFTVVGFSGLSVSMTYFYEKREGYLKNQLVRVNRRKLFAAKGIVYFCTAFFVSTLPLLIDFMIISVFLPALDPVMATSSFFIDSSDIFGVELFYSNPMLYFFIRMIITGLISAAFSETIFIAEKLFSAEYAVIIFPELLFLVMHILSILFQISEYSPYNIINPSEGYKVGWMQIIIIFALIMLVGFVGMGIRINEEEL